MLLQAILTPQADTTPWSWIALLVAVVGEVLALLFVMRALARGGEPSATLLWVVVILAAPWLGVALYYLFPRRLERRRLRVRQQKQEQRPQAGVAGPLSAVEQALQEGRAMHRLLHGVSPEAFSAGNRVEWMAGGQAFFMAAKAALEGAERCVELEVYILRVDDTGRKMLQLLAACAARGVEVRLLYDSFGSWGLGADDLEPLERAGGKVAAFHPLLWKRRPFTVNLRDHRKILVVDGRVAFVGGRNVGDEYATDRFGQQRVWHDAMVQVEGPGVAALRALFAENWFHATDEELHGDGIAVPKPVGQDCMSVVASGPDRDVQELWYAVFQAVVMAERSIVLSSPYLLPPSTLLFALQVAVRRGVRVRVYTNGKESEAAVLYNAQRSHYESMLEAGIEVYETTEDYNHAKVLVVDERTVVVGSANMDLRSAHLNWEVAVVLPDSPQLARQVVATVERRYAGLSALDRESLSSSVVRRVFDGFCRLFSPLL
jgi:cardiolipin synthase